MRNRRAEKARAREKYASELKGRLQEKYKSELRQGLKEQYKKELNDTPREKYGSTMKGRLRRRYALELKEPLRGKYVSELKEPLQHKYESKLRLPVFVASVRFMYASRMECDDEDAGHVLRKAQEMDLQEDPLVLATGTQATALTRSEEAFLEMHVEYVQKAAVEVFVLAGVPAHGLARCSTAGCASQSGASCMQLCANVCKCSWTPCGV